MQTSHLRLPTATRNSPPRVPYLIHSASLVDLHDNGRPWRYDTPSSPTESSSSSASDAVTPTASTMDYSESRSSTPTPSTPPPIFSSITYRSFPSKNPWRNKSQDAYNSPPISPKTTPQSTSPQSHSRASTPVATAMNTIAPQPLSPSMSHAAPDSMQYTTSWSRASPPAVASFSSPPYSEPELEKLPVQPITSELIGQAVKLIPRIISRYGWKRENATWVYQWAIQQPKLALLFWMCDDLQAWKRAMVYGLKDTDLPFEVENLEGIATDPQLVTRLQWKVAMKALPRGGQHVEFQTNEHVPLKDVGSLASCSSAGKTTTRVRYLDGADNQLYVRKRFEISAGRPHDKKTLLDQIKQFNRLEHDNIAKIMSSYARGSVVAIVSPLAQCTLDQYLEKVDDLSHSELLLSWTTDLCSALGYVHQKRMEHGCLRPQKILVDTSFNRIYLSVFGIGLLGRTPFNSYIYRPYSEDPAYIYAAPEVIARREIRHREVRQAGDVFSLGCCLLDMLSVAKGQPVLNAAKYRSSFTHDASFHANLDRVHSWIKQLASIKIPVAASRRSMSRTSANRMLKIVHYMMHAVPESRPTMKQILREMEEPSAHRAGKRRNSDVVTGGGRSVRPNPASPSAMSTSPPSPPASQPPEKRRHTPPRDEYSLPRASPSPPRQEGAAPPPAGMEFAHPRDSNIWDLQSLSDYYRGSSPDEPMSTAASVYDDGYQQDMMM